MKSWLSPKVEVRDSKIQGKGLFAKVKIAKRERVTRSGDENIVVMTDEEFQKYIKTVDSYNAVSIGKGLNKVYLSSREKDPINYGNHSCDPNMKDGVALRDIQSGEEITCDYALISSKNWSMRCNCGSPNCRGIVHGLVG